MVGKWYACDLNMLYKNIWNYIPARITTRIKRADCSRRKTNKYFYHKRKWNKEVTSNIKTGKKQIFNIYYLTDEHVALISVNAVFCLSSNNGSVFCCFLGFLFFWRFTGNNHLTSATKHRKDKRFMRGMKQLFCFSWHFWVSGRWKRKSHQKGLQRSLYWHNKNVSFVIRHRGLPELYDLLFSV